MKYVYLRGYIFFHAIFAIDVKNAESTVLISIVKLINFLFYFLIITNHLITIKVNRHF